MSNTGSQSAPQSDNQALTAQDNSVDLNWILFGKSCPSARPYCVPIPSSLFNGPSQYCRTLFAKLLHEERKADFKDRDILFWKPKEPLSIWDAAEEKWKASIDRLKDHFTTILPPESFSDKLVVGDNKIVHLVITIEESTFAATTKGKRKREDPVDISRRLSETWNVPFSKMLNVADLDAYLNAPLGPEEKIPISDLEWGRLLQPNPTIPEHFCCPEDLDILFTKNEDETAGFIWSIVLRAIEGSPPNPSGTEDSFHSFWDRNILDILFACLDEPKWIRNSNRGTHTGDMRPDFGLLLQLACVFRGEENAPMFTGTHPRQELAEKTRWVYDPAPYVLGYYAVGAGVTLAAIQPGVGAQGKKQIAIRDIVRGSLSTRRGRIGNVARMIKLVKLLRTLECTVERGVDADMLTVILDGGKSIEFLKTKIRKTYPTGDEHRVSFLKTIYNLLKSKQVPNVDRLTRAETSHPEYGCFVELEPRGINSGPESTDDIKNAVVSVLEALKVLHTSEPQIFHRDIRWPNVIQSLTDPKKWFLIDWEDAAIAPTQAAPNLRAGTHAPQVFEDGHGAEVDIWGVGRLIATANTYDLTEDLLSLGQRMVDGSIVSAQQGLEELKFL